jgi:hypothetical protein
LHDSSKSTAAWKSSSTDVASVDLGECWPPALYSGRSMIGMPSFGIGMPP